jgi:hypothetical protein
VDLAFAQVECIDGNEQRLRLRYRLGLLGNRRVGFATGCAFGRVAGIFRNLDVRVGFDIRVQREEPIEGREVRWMRRGWAIEGSSG